MFEWIRGRVKASETPPTEELGATGTVIMSGVIGETGEYLAEFRPGAQQRRLIEKMRRSDGQVKAGLLALTLPLLSAHWDVEPASSSPEDVKIANFVRDNILGGEMTITWDDYLRHVLLMLPFGFSVFEKVWALEDGMYKLKKLAPRLPATVYQWHADDTGDLIGIQQLTWKGTNFKYIDIPAEKLVVFTHEKEGSNFEGVSCLRAAYKHWYFKQTLYAIDGIAAERHGMGVAKFKFPKSATQAQRDKIATIAENLQAHERAYVALPDGTDFDLVGVMGQLHDIKGSIEHHDTQILRSILAQFITLGSGGVGSYAMSADQSGFFLMALRSTGKNICDTINTNVVKPLVDYNFTVKKYPKLAVSDLNYIDIAALSTALGSLGSQGFMTSDDGLEAELRRLMHLPPKTATKSKAPPKVELHDTLQLGGDGSGNFGHEGRPGLVGGSGEGGASVATSPRKMFYVRVDEFAAEHRGKENERMIAVDAEGSWIKAKMGDRTGIAFDPAELREMSRAEAIIHTHPVDLPHSASDILLQQGIGVNTSIVVGPNVRYTLSRDEHSIHMSKAATDAFSTAKRGEFFNLAPEGSTEKTHPKEWQQAQETALKRLVDKYKWQFTREER